MSKFEVGQSVRAVGNSQTGEEVNGQFGEVCDIHGPRWVQVRFESGRNFTMHTRNLNRLRKKPCPPQGERKAFVISKDGNYTVYGDNNPNFKAKPYDYWFVVELKPGEVLVTREMIYTQWLCWVGRTDKNFESFCKALGLEGSAK